MNWMRPSTPNAFQRRGSGWAAAGVEDAAFDSVLIRSGLSFCFGFLRQDRLRRSHSNVECVHLISTQWERTGSRLVD